MRTLGIIGGLSHESTVQYYQGINQGVQKRLGGHHNARIIINSLDFGEFVALKDKGDWDTQATLLVQAAQSLERAGVDFIILATNTMHKMADQIIAAIDRPFLHLADVTAQAIKEEGLGKVGLLGTRYTMELDFYKGRLEDHGLSVVVPDEAGRELVNRIIYDELCHGLIKDDSKQVYQEVIGALEQKGAQGVILGCTEIGMIVDQNDVKIAVFDTTQIHIEAAVKEILA